ncbi:MAG TPA: hypothetical protein VEY10_01060 [Flavisolibacter sp.]|nr:hypothetical protein [Flavisolibacter sp.]
MNNIRSNANRRTRGFPSFPRTQIIVLLFTVLICSILLFKLLPLLLGNESRNISTKDAVPQVEEYIKKHIIKDSESLEIVHWSKLVERTAMDMLSYRVGVVYKIKKANGDFRMESKVFDLDKNKNVMFEVSVPPFENM